MTGGVILSANVFVVKHAKINIKVINTITHTEHIITYNISFILITYYILI